MIAKGLRAFAALLLISPGLAPAQQLLEFRNDLAFTPAEVGALAARAYGARLRSLRVAGELDPDPALAARLGVSPDSAALARDEGVRKLLQAEVDEVNRRFARIEQIKRFAVLDRDLTLAAGELTPTMKVKRPVVYERYRTHFDELYE